MNPRGSARSTGNLDGRLKVCEIFTSIQGESTYAGLPCVFIRLTGCPLRCRYCDTTYAFTEGELMAIDEILPLVRQARVQMVEITGGEPLAQRSTPELCRVLLGEGYRVLVETSGALDISPLPNEVVIIMDVKTPGSGECHRNRWENLALLKPLDEVKFVITSREDFDWSVELVRRERLHERLSVLFSPAWGWVDPADLAAWVRDSGLPIRFQLPLHKVLWPHRERGV
ncbi:MAG: radical SAM protein [candidate division KSB1 bacterium]|nr:radical SAM protein [candidate division KSB1 bacterium]